MVGDLAGFAAACVRRGLDFVQVPTTLLAQVDSSVGGKTGINSRHGKNLVGAFHQPILVLADTALLDTLPPREFRAGYAEVAKYGLLGDAAFFAWLEANWQDVFAGGSRSASTPSPSAAAPRPASSRATSARTASARCSISATPSATRSRPAAGFSDRLLHGEAVALGMVLAFEFSARKGLIGEADAARVSAHLAAVGLPTHVKQVPGGVPGVDALMDLIAQDKKVKRGKLTFILVRGIGQAFIANNVDPAEVRAFLEREQVSLAMTSRRMTATIVNLLLALFLLAANAFYVAAEFALVKSRGFRIDAMAEENRFGARLVQNMLGNIEAYLACCQLGITMASLGLGWVGEPTVSALLKPVLTPLGMPESALHFTSFFVGFLVFSSLHIVLGEQVPKTLAIREPEPVSLWIAYPLHVSFLLFYPLNWLLNTASRSILRMLGVREALAPRTS